MCAIGMPRAHTHGGMLCIIASHRIDKEHVGTGLWDARSTEMMQHCPLHVLERVLKFLK